MEFSKISDHDIIEKLTKVPVSKDTDVKLSGNVFLINDEAYDLVTLDDWARAYGHIRAFRESRY